MLKMLAVFILALVLFEFLPYVILIIVGAVALLLKFAWVPIVLALILWLYTFIEEK